MKLYRAWMLLSFVLAIHVADEALHRFLDFYNPSALFIRAEVPWLILPTYTFPVWIALLGLAIAGVFILSYWVRKGLRWTIYASCCFAAVMLGNGIGHLGASMYVHMWMPGSYTAPLVLAGAICLFFEAWRAR